MILLQIKNLQVLIQAAMDIQLGGVAKTSNTRTIRASLSVYLRPMFSAR